MTASTHRPPAQSSHLHSAFNAAGTLAKVLDRIPENVKSVVGEIFVVDNASQDNTSIIAVDYRSTKGLHQLKVLKNKRNYGYGGSQSLPINTASKRATTPWSCSTVTPSMRQKLEYLLEPILKGEADMRFFGSRMAGNPMGGMPLYKFLGGGSSPRCRTRFWAPSSRNSTRAIACIRKALKQVPFTNLSDDYHFDTEIIILLVDRKMRIIEKPIPTYYGDEPNYVNVWKYGLQVLQTTFGYALHKRGFYKDRRYSKDQPLQMLDIKDNFTVL